MIDIVRVEETPREFYILWHSMLSPDTVDPEYAATYYPILDKSDNMVKALEGPCGHMQCELGWPRNNHKITAYLDNGDRKFDHDYDDKVDAYIADEDLRKFIDNKIKNFKGWFYVSVMEALRDRWKISMVNPEDQNRPYFVKKRSLLKSALHRAVERNGKEWVDGNMESYGEPFFNEFNGKLYWQHPGPDIWVGDMNHPIEE